MRDLYVAAVYAGLFGLGFAAPFAFVLGYVWVDVAFPQFIAPGLLGRLPISLMLAAAAIVGYLAADRRAPPGIGATALLTLAMAAWVTLTSTWAVAPEAAWVKWDWAFKTMLFSLAIPFFFRSRVQIEAFVLVFVFAALVHIVPVGVKAMLSGGRYGMELGILGNNLGFSESSNLATISILFIPVYLAMRRHSVLLPPGFWRAALFAGLILLSLATAIGTVARTAVVGFCVAGPVMWIRSRRKLLFGAVVAATAVVGVSLTSNAWSERISTIETFQQESSALVRILVWRWTLGFVAEHPLGGGFEAYRVDRVEIPAGPDGGEPRVEVGRAFHSMYFELLGEHGWPGLGLYLAIALRSLWAYQTVIQRTRDVAGLAWCHDLAAALQCALLTLLACGAFIGIAFQPTFWYLAALSVCLRAHLRRAEPAGAGVPRGAIALAGAVLLLAAWPAAVRAQEVPPVAGRTVGQERTVALRPGRTGGMANDYRVHVRLADGGRVLYAPGTYTQSVHIGGDFGFATAVVAAAQPAWPPAVVLDGSSGEWAWGKAMVLVSGAAANTPARFPTSLTLDGVLVRNTGLKEHPSDGSSGAYADAGGSLFVRNSDFEGNTNGISATRDADLVDVADSAFSLRVGNGAGDGRSHDAYVMARRNLFTRIVVGGLSTGNDIKVRAPFGRIDQSFLVASNGRWLDAPWGGDMAVSNSVLVQAPGAASGNLVAYAEEGSDMIDPARPASGRIRYVNDLIVVTRHDTAIMVDDGEVAFEGCRWLFVRTDPEPPSLRVVAARGRPGRVTGLPFPIAADGRVLVPESAILRDPAAVPRAPDDPAALPALLARLLPGPVVAVP